MRLLKRIDGYVIKNFLLLFLATFFICSFVLIMQFLWMRIGELVGKGLPISVIAELFFYAWLSMVPMALPLAILLASLMSFGNMGENLELLAMKTAGISLFRIMRGLIVLVSLMSVGAFFFSNNVIPVAQKKMWALLFSIRSKSPELNIPVGEFYSEISSYRIYVRGKDHDTGALSDVMVYDLSKGFDRASVTTADTMFVRMAENKRHLRLIMVNGETFENLDDNNGFDTKNVPYRRETFKRREMLIAFDANFNEMDESLLDDQHVSKNVSQLRHDMDSIDVICDSLRDNLVHTMFEKKYYVDVYADEDTVNQLRDDRVYSADSLFANANRAQRTSIVSNMYASVNSTKSDVRYNEIIISDADSYFSRHSVEWYRKFTLSVACFIFFFIGAPLGAIIRKGGLGMPVVVSVIMFIVYYIIDTMGVKMAREMIWPVWQGMCLSSIVLFVVGVFLTYKAVRDSTLFNFDAWVLLFGKMKAKVMVYTQKINK